MKLQRHIFRFLILGIWACVLLLAGTQRALAGVEPYRQSMHGFIKKGDTLVVKDEKFNNPSYNWSAINNRSVTNLVTFGLFRDTTLMMTKPFTCNLDLKVEYWSSPSQVDPTVVAHVPLKINYDTAAGAVFQPKDVYSFMNGYRVKITVNDITSPELGSTLPAYFTLESQVIIDRKYTGAHKALAPIVSLLNNPPAAQQSAQQRMNVMALNATTASDFQVTVNFNSDETVEEYDLEWTYLDEMSKDIQLLASPFSNTTDAVMAKLFRNNSTRVTLTTQQQYNISIVNPDQYLLIRSRTVTYNDDGIRVEGDWSYRATIGGTVVANIVQLNNARHQPAFNWNYTATFAEDGKKKEIVSYFDGTFRSRQAVTVNNSDNKSIVQEDVYDQFGRPLAKVLPAPINDQRLQYYPGMNLNASGQAYSFRDVYTTANGTCIPQPQPMANTAGASRYYSPNNDFINDHPYNKYIPDAEGYPFAVNAYTHDNTGRIASQGGVGLALQPNTDDTKNHTTRFYYGKPFQWELDRIFGSDAGLASHYLRNTTIDPNGQSSITYVNMAGKTVATALAGEAPASLSALPSKPVPQLTTVQVLQPADFTYDPTALTITGTSTYLPSTTGTANFTYNVDKLIQQYVSANVHICSNCYYTLDISVADDCGNVVYTTGATPVQIGSITPDCNAGGTFTGSFSASFARLSEYYITYRLSYSPDVITAFTENYVAQNTDLKTQFQFVLDQLKQTDFSGCYSDCRTCLASLGAKTDFVAAMVGRAGADGVDLSTGTNNTVLTTWAGALYDNLLANCQQLRLTCLGDPCQDTRNLLAQDVVPGGQYALFDKNYQPLEKEINIIDKNWRNEFPVISSTSDPTYVANMVTLDDGSTLSVNDAGFTETMFVKYWRDEWAGFFVKYHPDSCALKFCNNNAVYLSWDQQVQQVYSKAADIGSIKSGLVYNYTAGDWLMNADPFFQSTGAGASLASQMRSDLQVYSNVAVPSQGTGLNPKSLSQYVDYVLYCNNPDGGSNTNVNNGTSPTLLDKWNNCLPNADCRVPDLEWQQYQELYFELKQKYYKTLRDALCSGGCPRAYASVVDPTATSCPPVSAFTVMESDNTGCTASQHRIRVSYTGTIQKPTRLTLLYPVEVASFSRVNDVTFNPGDQYQEFCVDTAIDVRTIHVYAADCGTTMPPSRGDMSAPPPPCNGALYANSFVLVPDSYPATWPPDNTQWRYYYTLEYQPNPSLGRPVVPDGVQLQIKVVGKNFDATPADTMVYSFPFSPTYTVRFGIWARGHQTGQANIASVDCPPPSTCSNLLAVKQSRLDDLDNPTAVSNDTTTLKANGQTQITDQVNSSCTGMAEGWMSALADYLNTNNVTTAKRNELRAQLIEVCEKGGDLVHPFGARNTAPGLTTSEGYTSFAGVIQGVLGSSGTGALQWLIASPYTRDVPVMATEQIVTTTNADICGKVSALQTDYNANHPAGQTFYTYLQTRFSDAMTLTSAQLDVILKGCTNCKYLLSQAVRLPVFLMPGHNNCVTADDFNTALTALGSQVTGSPLSDANSTVLQNFMNLRWGFALGASAYQDYGQFVATNYPTTKLLCNKMGFVTYDPDPYQCMQDLVDNDVNAASRLYVTYIDSVKRAFRKQYIATCSAANTFVNMQKNEQIYHYTLYYYDQAGNLIRTVPPEGVEVLNTSEVAQVASVRTNPTLSCNYNGPDHNTDLPTALQDITNAFSGTSQSMEMWLYNPDNALSHMVTATGGNKYLLSTCLDRKYLHLDIYPVTQGGGTELDLGASIHIAADIAPAGPLKPWIHIVMQGANMASGAITVYVNGVACPLVTDAPAGNCQFGVATDGTNVTATQDLSMVKQMRFYSRVLTGAEIARNAAEPCMGINATDVVSLNGVLTDWARFNVPDVGNAGTIAGTNTEFQNSQVYPVHRMASNYSYNSLAQTAQLQTPDAGMSKFWYDKLDRVIASQNAQQAADGNVYSYTFYDALGRIQEVGQKIGVITSFPAPDFLSDVVSKAFAIDGTNEQITTTYYDQPYTGSLTLRGVQDNLRKRVSFSKYSALSTTTDGQAVINFYTYDPLGNVTTFWKHLPGLGMQQTDYLFDLVSGKVNKVRYQFGKPDQFYYQYDYDAENRLTNVSSSVSSLAASAAWSLVNIKEDAHYQYYLHGPLGRELLGGDRALQGVDYAYTLQGWLKGVNGNTANGSQDIGGDGMSGNPSVTIARDAVSYSLNYFDNDYQPLAASAKSLGLFYQHQAGDMGGQALYNGNIGSNTVAFNNLINGAPVGYAYHYDQLNRLLHMQQHILGGTGTNVWNARQGVLAYSEQVKYDGNGNILFLNRNGSHPKPENLVESNADMDRLSYIYPTDGIGRPTSNRLRHIRDEVEGSNYDNKDVVNEVDDNYKYDNTGNLIEDKANGIDKIEWNLYRKITQITKTSGSVLKYFYDAAGNRIYKEYIHGGEIDKTWYARDAQGYTLAVYGNKSGDDQIYWNEQDLYGSNRLGIWHPGVSVTSNVGTDVNAGATSWRMEGLSRYELTNQLGNVLSTISDERVAVDIDNNGTIDYYLPMIASYSDYTPFGMQMIDRNGNTGSYRYGFNGKENDNEEKDEGSQQDYGMRVYDPRLGRFLSVDPDAYKYVDLSPYCFAANNPIAFNDEDGRGPKPPIVRLLFWGGARKVGDNGAFKHAMENVKDTYGGTGNSFFAASAKFIIDKINQQADGSIGSLDFFTHGSPVALYMVRDKNDNSSGVKNTINEDNVEENNLYAGKTVRAIESWGGGEDRGVINSIDCAKFTYDAVIEAHGCSVAADRYIVLDNFASNLSSQLYDAGKKDAVVIGHLEHATPNINGEKTKISEQDYRHGPRAVFHNGELLFQTNESGAIDKKTIKYYLNKKAKEGSKYDGSKETYTH